MPKYEHTFADLGKGSETTDSVVDLGPDPAATDATGRGKINDAPGNPDSGKPDQFDELPSNRAQAAVDDAKVDDGIDLDIDEDDKQTGDTQQGDEDDLKDLSKSARERIQRERRLRQEAEERSRRTEAELANISRKVDLQAQESEWKAADEKDNVKLTELKAAKTKAIEEGKTADQVDLDDKITDVKAALQERARKRTEAQAAAKQAPQQQRQALNPEATAWIEKHPQYNNDPLFREAANAADRVLHTQGFNSNTRDYYRRLSRMMSQSGRFKLDSGYLSGGRTDRRGGPGGVNSTGRRTGGDVNGIRTGTNGRVSVTITAEDKALLASMGQDAEDPAVQKAFAREKISLARSEAKE